jgi:hypothetical protein
MTKSPEIIPPTAKEAQARRKTASDGTNVQMNMAIPLPSIRVVRLVRKMGLGESYKADNRMEAINIARERTIRRFWRGMTQGQCELPNFITSQSNQTGAKSNPIALTTLTPGRTRTE